MTDKEKIKAEIERMMSEEKTFFEDNCKHGNAESSSSAVVYTRLQMLLKRIDSLPEEPVSEDLEEAAFDYAEICKYDGGDKLLCVEHFKAGANWQKEQFEKNRLAACERQTREEAEREYNFLSSFIKNEQRQPTFSDAIEYGIRWQKQHDIDKACEWLEDHANDYEFPYCPGYDSDALVEDFRKAMED